MSNTSSDAVEIASSSPEMEFISFLASSLLEDDFHRNDPATSAKISALIQKVGLEYAAKATLLARHKLDVRNAAFLAAGELSQLINGQPWAANFYRRLPQRPDDVLAIIVYIRARYKKIPSRVKRGLGSYLRNCSEATLSAYKEKKHFSMKLVDAVNLIHPKHSDPLRKLVHGSLPLPVPIIHSKNGDGASSSRNGSTNGDGEVRHAERGLNRPFALASAVREVDLMA
jgi:hypothetical protein